MLKELHLLCCDLHIPQYLLFQSGVHPLPDFATQQSVLASFDFMSVDAVFA